MNQDEAYQEAEQRIEKARRSGAGFVDLSNNRLTVLPESLGRCKWLQALNLFNNQLTVAPEWLGQLRELQSLNLMVNRLTALPESLGQLTELKTLNLGDNQLTTLPESFGQLTQLQSLDLNGNQLTALPESIGQLKRLKSLDLDGNPLNPDLAAAYKDGVKGVRAYLREMAKGARRRYEAKLLILGDGNEGKTCVSRALRDLAFEDQPTTRGVDVEQWRFPHPADPEDGEKEVTLNIWDFEGQEINHQTHQFFLASDALYLLVFKCRDQFPPGRAEYWLDTIRARAPRARVAIVISQCEERTPYVPEDRLKAEYGDILVDGQWLYAAGCKDKSGIPELQEAVKHRAANLAFMGREWPKSYSQAETAIKAKADAGVPHIGRADLHGIFAKASIDGVYFDAVASAMATLGVLTQFPECPDLRDFIVLRPQWLTKAISEVMEDKGLADDKGMISQQRMRALWENGYAGMFPTFHNCMKEFELCYDLGHCDRSCLVPLRFGYDRPETPWTSDENARERRVSYKLNIRPPMGLMSRFIVKTHHMIVKTEAHPHGVYWHNGVFLRTGEGPLCSEALCEFDTLERTLNVTVRAAFPQNLIEQIHAYVKAVFSFYAGLEPQRLYGCIRIDDKTKDEAQCKGMHSERRIYSAIMKKRILDCEYEFHDVDPQVLISGFSSFGEYVLLGMEDLRRELDKSPDWAKPVIRDISTLMAWANENIHLLEEIREKQDAIAPEIKQEMEQKLREYLGHFSQMLDDRDFTSAPGIISLDTIDGSKWNPRTYFEKQYVLTPYCECEGNIHACEDGKVVFKKDRDWWKKSAPWIARGTKFLSVGLGLAFAGMPLGMSTVAFAAIKNDVAFMNALAKNIELKVGDADKTVEVLTDSFEDYSWNDLCGEHTEKQILRAVLSRFLKEVAPDNYRARRWGSLRRVRMSDDSYRWLCEKHAKNR